MKKLFSLIVLALLGGGGYLYKQGYRIDGLDKLALLPNSQRASGEGDYAPPPVERKTGSNPRASSAAAAMPTGVAVRASW